MNWVMQNSSFIGQLFLNHTVLIVPPLIVAFICAVLVGALGAQYPRVQEIIGGSLSAALHHSLTTVASDNPDLFGGFYYFTGNCHGGTGPLCRGVTCSNQYRRICLGG